ncbi:MAG: molybdopterin-guanine dinucleotide biosynthesis protein B [Coriobacteriales bacterium]|jgi:molybdopterin-guanine dinucleotide biosynthesis protein MobB
MSQDLDQNETPAGSSGPASSPDNGTSSNNGANSTPAPAPAVAFIGKSGSGKTVLTVKVIAELTARGYRVGSIKHHGHKKFDIDVPGKDSWRHTQAGSVHTVVASPDKIASYRKLDHELEFSQIVQEMTDVDIVVVEGYRHGGAPSFELFRSGNPKDEDAALDPDVLSSDDTVAVVTDMPDMRGEAGMKQIPCFDFEDVGEICDFIEFRFLKD